MEFRLTYRGPLKSNGRPPEKQKLRRHFHRQLKELWSQPPLNAYRHFLEPKGDGNELSVLMKRKAFTFAPLVCSELALVTELDVTFLRPGGPGQLVGHGGDIDNRMKTLLDSLCVPPHSNQIPTGDEPAPDEAPLYCLLGDDALVTRLNVETDRLLDADASEGEVLLLVKVTTRQVRTLIATIGLA